MTADIAEYVDLDEAAGLRKARSLAAQGCYADARGAYVAVLKGNADCLPALVELGALALQDGYGQAACSAFSRAIGIDPQNAVALTGLGNLLMAEQNYGGAKTRFAAALRLAPEFAPAHQGLARCLTALAEDGAAPHWRAGHEAVASIQPSGDGRIAVLLLAAAIGGNVPCKDWIDPKNYSVTTVYADFFDAAAALPPHDLVVNAIGDADLCGVALRQARRMTAASAVPVINPPQRVLRTSRLENAARLRAIPGVVTPRMALLAKAALRPESLRFPVLLRAPGFHTGRHFLRVEEESALLEAVASLPGEELLAIEFKEQKAEDGLARKYRVMFIGGEIFPLHLAAGADWKVHYFTSAMAESERLRAEEQRFLADMPAVLGARAMAALQGINEALGLDYAGVDFALGQDGSIILFEANATMVIQGPDERAIWDYRRPAIDAAKAAVKAMLRCCAAAVRRYNTAVVCRRVDFPVQ